MAVRLSIVFIVVYLLTVIAFLPLRYVLSFIDLPQSLKVDINSGSVWKGEGHILIEAEDAQFDFDIAWRTCLSKAFPFYGNCFALQNQHIKLRAKLVGIPQEELLIQSVNGRLDLSLSQDLLRKNAPLVAFVKPQGQVDINLDRLSYSIVDNKPLSWQGNIEVSSLSVFNIQLPDIVGQLTQAPFSSQNPREVLFADQTLPTFRLSGGDEKLGFTSQGQFLPDKQVKVASEFTVLDNSLRSAIQAITTRRQGNKYFWEYQGPYGLDEGILAD